MNGKIKDPDKRTHQAPSSHSAKEHVQTPLMAWEALTLEHIKHEGVGRGAYWGGQVRALTWNSERWSSCITGSKMALKQCLASSMIT